MIWRPWVRYGPEGSDSMVEWTATWPQLAWDVEDGGVGGDDIAASGIPEAYVIREDWLVSMRWRVMEDEMLAFRAFMQWARGSGQPFLMRLNADDPATEYEVYLHFPRWTDGPVLYERDEEVQELFVVPLAVRTEAGQPITTPWWGTE